MSVYLVISLPKILYIYESGQPILGDILRVGQNRIYTPYMTVYLVISLPKILYIYGSGQPILGNIHRVGQNRIYTP
jgi:hypothetical protein